MDKNFTNCTSTDSGNSGSSSWFGFMTIVPGIIANIVAIVFFSKAARKTGFVVHHLLLVLSWTDLAGCISAGYAASTVYTGPIQDQTLCNTITFCMTLCPIVTTLVAGLLAVDRYFALCDPFRYPLIFTRRTVLLFVCICLLSSAAICLLPLMGLGRYHMVILLENGCTRIECSALRFSTLPHQMVFGITYGFVGIAVIILVIGCNVRVIRCVLIMRKTVCPTVIHLTAATVAPPGPNRRDLEIKFAKMIAGISVILLICWTPYMVLVILIHTGVPVSSSSKTSVLIVASLNFIIDPFVHIILRQSYRQALWQSFSCCACSKVEERMTALSTLGNYGTNDLENRSSHM